METVVTSSTEYEYRGLMAQFWDFFRGDTRYWKDRFFFLEAIQKYGTPALDVGCGTGRILLDFLQQGLEIEGVDNSPEMLALCRHKAAQLNLFPILYQQNMETLELPRQYQTILVPSSSFQLITDQAAVRQTMHRFVAHLLPGGFLVMPFMKIWQESDPLDSGLNLVSEKTRPSDGATIRRWSRAVYDPVAEVEHTEDRYEVVINGQIVDAEHHQRPFATRNYTAQQAQNVYTEAGLVEIELYEDFSWIPAQPDSSATICIVGKKPA